MTAIVPSGDNEPDAPLCPVNPSRKHLFGFIDGQGYFCRCGERLAVDCDVPEAVMQELLESYGEGTDTDMGYLTDLRDLVVEMIEKHSSDLRQALRLIGDDMHVRGARPCPTCKEITKAIGQPFGCEVRR